MRVKRAEITNGWFYTFIPPVCLWLGQVQLSHFPFTSFINHPSIWCYVILGR